MDRFCIAWMLVLFAVPALAIDAQPPTAPVPSDDQAWQGEFLQDPMLGNPALGNSAASQYQRPDTFDPLEADRPDFTESPTVVPRGRLQLESGWTYYRDRSSGVTSDLHTLPELLLRYGLSDRVELRLVWPGYAYLEETDQNAHETLRDSGYLDMAVGCKVQITKQDGLLMESAMILSVTAPTGTMPWTSDRVDTAIDYIYGWDLNDRVSFTASTGSVWTKEAEDHYSITHQTMVLGLGITERFGCFIEWFGLFFHGSNDDRPMHCMDSGITYLVTEDFQLDWRIGTSLSESGDDLFTGAGFAVRW